MLLHVIPQLFLVVGIYLFLAGSIITVLFSEHYPRLLPHMLALGGIVGFALLWFGRDIWSGTGDLQFYCCVGFAITAFVSLLLTNVYLLLVKKKRLLSAVFAIVITVPSCLILLFLLFAYSNAILLNLPLSPTLPSILIYTIFFVSLTILIIIVLATIRHKNILSFYKIGLAVRSIASLAGT
jgi:hypothetical protein